MAENILNGLNKFRCWGARLVMCYSHYYHKSYHGEPKI
jgi:hypothetical protein